MKKKFLNVALMSVLLLATAVFSVQAGGPGGGRRGCEDCPKSGVGSGRFLERMTQVLDLSEAQRDQIGAILMEERAKTEPLRQQMSENRTQMHQLMQSTTFDEAAIRELAAKKAVVSEELMVSKARTRNLIQAQLTPEQREKADKLFPMRGDRRGGERNFRQPDCPKGLDPQ